MNRSTARRALVALNLGLEETLMDKKPVVKEDVLKKALAYGANFTNAEELALVAEIYNWEALAKIME